MLIAMSVLLAQAALLPELDADRKDTLGKASAVMESVEEFRGFVKSRFAADTDPPKVGVLVMSANEPGEDGLHAITVLGVHSGSPAARAGIRPGDRIVAIGARRLEHEPAMVVHMLMDDAPGPVALTVARRGETAEVTVHRAPLPCMREAAQNLDTRRWLEQLETMRKLLLTIREQLGEHEFRTLAPDQREAALVVARVGVATVASLLPALVEYVGIELHQETVRVCRTDFR